jgi:hypothetical protein
MKITPITAIAGLIVIGAGGFMAGRVSSPPPQTTEQASPTDTRATRASSRDLASASAESRRIARSAKAENSEAGMTPERLSRLESIVRGENPLERNRALLAFIDQLGPGDFEQAVASFRSIGITDDRLGEYSLLLTAWGQADPLAALTYAKANTGNNFATDTILTSWATTDPEAAIRWAQAEYQGDGANPYIPGIIRGLIDSDPTRATQLLASLPRSEERGQGLDYILPHLLQQGPDATRSWIAAITDDSLRNGAMLRSAVKLAATDPAGTAAWLLANPGEATQRRLDEVYSTWAKKDQSAALSALTSIPAGDDRSNALRGVVNSMASADPKAALSLMDTYPSDVNDRVVQNFIWHSYGTDPSVAASQISRISNENDRDQMYRRMLSNWIERDPSTAQAWMQSNPVPQAVRDRIASRQAERQ